MKYLGNLSTPLCDMVFKNGNRICTYPVGTGSMAVEDTGYYCFYIDSCIIIPLIILESGKISGYGM